MKKIITIVGARPQFIKAAAVSRILRKSNKEILVHTGQHYDSNMSEIFFEELDIPKPDYNLRVGSSTHAKQTAEMMVGIEDILIKNNPDYVMLYGDTNSTLAGALAAAKLCIPIIHIEAGLRSYNMKMPEEQNRILTDRISTILCCPTESAVNNLAHEGIIEGVYNVGDVMCDAVLRYSNLIDQKSRSFYVNQIEGLFNSKDIPDKWYIATVHRAENTDTIEKLETILAAFERLKYPVIFPVHPRIRKYVQELNDQKNYQNIYFIQPVGYMEMLYLVKHAEKTITDSGGLQKETYILNTPCVTLRNQTEWGETLNGNHNILCDIKEEEIFKKITGTKIDWSNKKAYYGDGNAAEKICDLINRR